MPDAIEYCDILDADPAPRELGPAAERYVRINAPYVYVVIAAVLLCAPALMVLVALPRLGSLAFAAATILPTAAFTWLIAQRRAELRRFLVEARQVPARIVDASELTLRRGFVVARRITLDLDVEGRRVRCGSWTGDLEGATRGYWLRVLVHPSQPGTVIPVTAVT